MTAYHDDTPFNPADLVDAAELIFFGLDDAMAARDELIAAGFTFEVVDDVDLDSNAVFVEVTHAGIAWGRVDEIIRPFRGDCQVAHICKQAAS